MDELHWKFMMEFSKTNQSYDEFEKLYYEFLINSKHFQEIIESIENDLNVKLTLKNIYDIHMWDEKNINYSRKIPVKDILKAYREIISL